MTKINYIGIIGSKVQIYTFNSKAYSKLSKKFMYTNICKWKSEVGTYTQICEGTSHHLGLYKDDKFYYFMKYD